MAYVLTRIVSAIPTLFVVVTIIFFVIRATPGDPALAALGDNASAAALDTFRQRMGLYDPLWLQYWNFISDLAQGNLGVSLASGRGVNAQIAAVVPHTIQLTFSAILVGMVIGIPLGVACARKPNSPVDYFGRLISLAGLSFPSFFLAIILMYIFAVTLGLFPTVGAGPFNDPARNLYHLILPALSLGAIATAYITRVTRSTVLNTLSEDYVRTAKAKGAPAKRVMFRHALRPALVPVVSLVGVFSVSLLGGSVMTEIVFARPGLGRTMVQATLQRDYTLLQSCMVVFAVIVIVMNLITDILYGLLDPQVRAGR